MTERLGESRADGSDGEADVPGADAPETAESPQAAAERPPAALQDAVRAPDASTSSGVDLGAFYAHLQEDVEERVSTLENQDHISGVFWTLSVLHAEKAGNPPGTDHVQHVLWAQQARSRSLAVREMTYDQALRSLYGFLEDVGEEIRGGEAT